jgi:hypothetical protein
MFQYAAGRAISVRLKAPLFLDLSSYDIDVPPYRKYELDQFNIQAQVASTDQLKVFSDKSSRFLFGEKFLRRYRANYSDGIFRESSYRYDSRINTLKSPALILGYWQSEMYFADIAQLIRKEFVASISNDLASLKIINEIKRLSNRSVSLHVRRGDYVTDAHTASYHGTCTLDYYNSACARISAIVDSPHFFVFSDDPSWINNNFVLEYPYTVVSPDSPNQALNELMIMKACAHHIIANSTFSWWGAWLSNQAQKIVIAPKLWFKQAPHDTTDLLPKSWVTL